MNRSLSKVKRPMTEQKNLQQQSKKINAHKTQIIYEKRLIKKKRRRKKRKRKRQSNKKKDRA